MLEDSFNNVFTNALRWELLSAESKELLLVVGLEYSWKAESSWALLSLTLRTLPPWLGHGRAYALDDIPNELSAAGEVGRVTRLHTLRRESKLNLSISPSPFFGI